MDTETTKTTEHVSLEEIAAACREGRPLRFADRYQIEVANEKMEAQQVMIDDPVPTGRQILEASSLLPAEDYMLLMIQQSGMLEEVNLSENIDIYNHGVEQFVAFKNDRIFYLNLNGRRFPWGADQISEKTLRKVGNVPETHTIWMERTSEADHFLVDGESIDLAEAGLEKLYSKPKSWKLNVQGVLVTSDEPTIIASDALRSAGFNPDKGWILILKVKGEPKHSSGLNDLIDLRNPGIEKLRLTPAEINNGESATDLSASFSLLDKDNDYLQAQTAEWETVIDAGRRWLLIHHYQLPSGYNNVQVTVAIEIPTSYPEAAIDMFYVYPALKLISGTSIPKTQNTQVIGGLTYQRWSRHLNGATRWNPLTDSVATFLAVVEESILREVGE
jgi:hypothetical protein